ncbi:MAG: class I SAM-dependent methyltransferase [Chloroflexota bacterium]
MTTQTANKHKTTYESTNLAKHTSPNPLQRLLIDRFHQKAAKLFNRTQAQSVLDAGCGEGFGMQHVMQRGNAHIVGLDSSVGALHLAQHTHPNKHFASGSLPTLPFPNARFDLVVCMEVLEHLDDPTQGLAELCRVSRQWLLLSVPNEPFFRGANFLRGKNVAALGNDPGHVNHWSSRGFARFVSKQLHIVERQQSFPWTLILCQTM